MIAPDQAGPDPERAAYFQIYDALPPRLRELARKYRYDSRQITMLLHMGYSEDRIIAFFEADAGHHQIEVC